MKIVNVAVVTFNRLSLLKKTLESLENQSYPINKIYVIDNASSDGTSEWLLEYVKNKQKIEVIIMPTNTGGAGGFYEGMKTAYKTCEYVWLMDDDGRPEKDCLANLISKADKNAILNPLVLNEDDHNFLSFRLGKFTTKQEVESSSIGGLIWGHVNPFNGTLIESGVIDRIGLPKKDMFIWGDEEEYILRAKRLGVNVYTVVNALHYHPKEKSIKNKVLGGLLGVVNIKPLNMQNIYLRNQFYNAIEYKLYFKLFVTFTKYIVFSIQDANFNLLKITIQSLKDA
ncbi:glycosyltransferase family 2 protein, partial [Vibrio cholerae]|nr:glycosyltransferase family 2 protein [Vibrio cholerae]